MLHVLLYSIRRPSSVQAPLAQILVPSYRPPVFQRYRLNHFFPREEMKGKWILDPFPIGHCRSILSYGV